MVIYEHMYKYIYLYMHYIKRHLFKLNNVHERNNKTARVKMPRITNTVKAIQQYSM